MRMVSIAPGSLGIQLDIGGKTRAAQPHQAGIPHGVQEILVGLDNGGLDAAMYPLLAVGFDDHRLGGPSPRQEQLGDGLDGAGNAGVDGGGEGLVAVPHHLADLDGVPRSDDRVARNAQMLGHGEDDRLGWGHHDGFTVRRVLAVGGVDASPDRVEPVFQGHRRLTHPFITLKLPAQFPDGRSRSAASAPSPYRWREP